MIHAKTLAQVGGNSKSQVLPTCGGEIFPDRACGIGEIGDAPATPK
jgi:hypothetical protein